MNNCKNGENVKATKYTRRSEDFEQSKSYDELSDYEVQKYTKRNGLNVEKYHEIEQDENMLMLKGNRNEK